MSKSKNKGRAKKPNNTNKNLKENIDEKKKETEAVAEAKKKAEAVDELKKKAEAAAKMETAKLEEQTVEAAKTEEEAVENAKKRSSGFYASVVMAIIGAILVAFCIGDDMYRKAAAKENTKIESSSDKTVENQQIVDSTDVVNEKTDVVQNTDSDYIQDKGQVSETATGQNEVQSVGAEGETDTEQPIESDKEQNSEQTDVQNDSQSAGAEGETDTEQPIESNKEQNSEQTDVQNDLQSAGAEGETDTEQPIAADTEQVSETGAEQGDDTAESVSHVTISEEDDNARYELITGFEKQKYTVGNMPEGFKNEAQAKQHMKTLSVNVWKLREDNTRYSSRTFLTVHSEVADTVQEIFDEIYALDMQFPIKQLVGFVYRKVGGVGLVNSKLMSVHSFGVAIDINPGDYDNDYFLGKGNDLRNKDNPYCIPDEVIDIFEKHGWFWGGNFDISSDTMHFQFFGLDFLQYDDPDEPFPILYKDSEANDYNALINLQQRLIKTGYLTKQYAKFNNKVDKAVKAFQEENGLEADGIVNYATWEKLINITHDMSYVF